MTKAKHLFLYLMAVMLAVGVAGCKKESEQVKEPTPQEEPTPGPGEKPSELKAMYENGLNLINPEKGDVDYEEAIKIFKTAADQGDSSSMIAEATLIEYGLGTKQNVDSAIAIYEKLAKNGSVYAKYKLESLSSNEDNNRLELTKESDYRYNEIFVYSDEGLQIVNGNHSFEASGSFVSALNGKGEILYFCLRNSGNNGAITLDSKETATSLLIATLPYVLNLEVGDGVFDKFKNEVRALKPTEDLADKIDECIVKKGFLDMEEISDAFDKSTDEFYSMLFEEGSQPNSVSKTYKNISEKGASANMSKSASSTISKSISDNKQLAPKLVLGGEREVPGDVLSNQSVEFRLDNYSYDGFTHTWDCDFHVTNLMNPFYVSLTTIELPKTESSILEGKSSSERIEKVLKPFEAPDVLSFEGWKDILKGDALGVWDLITKGQLNEYYSSDMDYNMKFSSEKDAIAVTSFSNNNELLCYFLVKDWLFPAIKSFFKSDKKKDDNKNDNKDDNKDGKDAKKDDSAVKFATKLALNEKLWKNALKMYELTVSDNYSDSEFQRLFQDTWDVMVKSVRELIVDYIKDDLTKDIIDDEYHWTEKGQKYAEGFKYLFGSANEYGFGVLIYNIPDKVESSIADAMAADPVSSILVKIYKGTRKVLHFIQPFTGFGFKPFTVSISPESFFHFSDVTITSDGGVMTVGGTFEPASEIELWVDDKLVSKLSVTKTFVATLPTDKAGYRNGELRAVYQGDVIAVDKFSYLVADVVNVSMSNPVITINTDKSYETLEVSGNVSEVCDIDLEIGGKVISSAKGVKTYAFNLPIFNAGTFRGNVIASIGGVTVAERPITYTVTKPTPLLCNVTVSTNDASEGESVVLSGDVTYPCHVEIMVAGKLLQQYDNTTEFYVTLLTVKAGKFSGVVRAEIDGEVVSEKHFEYTVTNPTVEFSNLTVSSESYTQAGSAFIIGEVNPACNLEFVVDNESIEKLDAVDKFRVSLPTYKTGKYNGVIRAEYKGTVSVQPFEYTIYPVEVTSFNLTSTWVVLDESVVLSGSLSEDCDIVVTVGSKEIASLKDKNEFYVSLPSTKIGDYNAKFVAKRNGVVVAEKNVSYTVHSPLSITHLTLTANSVEQDESLILSGKVSETCDIEVYVGTTLVSTIKNNSEFYVTMPTDKVGKVSGKIKAKLYDIVVEQSFSYTVLPKPTETDATVTPTLPDVSGSKLENDGQASGTAPGVKGQDVNQTYNGSGSAPDVKGENLDQIYNGSGSAPDVKGTNL